MIVLIKLILAHLIGDFVLQPKSWVEEKERLRARSPELYYHIAIHGLLILILLGSFEHWLLALLLTLFHGVIDLLKLYWQQNKIKWFIADQLLHLLAILVLWAIFIHPDFAWIENYRQNTSLWLYLTAWVFLTVVSGLVVQILMSNWSKALDAENDNTLINAGKYIGILERLFVFTFIVTGHWEGIGFLLAAKSVFRFGDLKESKDRNLTEYILIGTLLSFGIAVATALAVMGINRLIN